MATHGSDHERERVREREPVPLSQRLLLRPEEAAAMLGLSRTTIYELLRAGELQTVHIGRATRIPARELRRWIEFHTDARDARSTGHFASYGASDGTSGGA